MKKADKKQCYKIKAPDLIEAKKKFLERQEKIEKENAERKDRFLFSKDGLQKLISNDMYNKYIQHRFNKEIDPFVDCLAIKEKKIIEICDRYNLGE